MKQYRILHNEVTSKIRKAQTNYYKSKIEKNNGNSKCMLRTIKQWLNKRKSQCVNSEDLSPSKFNQYFATIGANLGAKFNAGNNLFWNLPESMCQFKFMNLVLSSWTNSFRYVQPIPIYMYLDLIPIFSRWNQNI